MQLAGTNASQLNEGITNGDAKSSGEILVTLLLMALPDAGSRRDPYGRRVLIRAEPGH